MGLYTLPITIEANSQIEAEQKLQQLIQGAALPQRTAVGKVVGSILFEMLDYYMTKKGASTSAEKGTNAHEFIKNQENKKSTER